MRAITPQEKITESSRNEIERISFLLEKYSRECKISFIDGSSFLMAKCGYKKYNYIPCDNEDLFLLMQLSVKYMRVYSLRPEVFIQTLLNCYDYCKIHGYSKNCEQQTLKIGRLLSRH